MHGFLLPTDGLERIAFEVTSRPLSVLPQTSLHSSAPANLSIMQFQFHTPVSSFNIQRQRHLRTIFRRMFDVGAARRGPALVPFTLNSSLLNSKPTTLP